MADRTDVVGRFAQSLRFIHVGQSTGFQVFAARLGKFGERTVEWFELAISREKRIRLFAQHRVREEWQFDGRGAAWRRVMHRRALSGWHPAGTRHPMPRPGAVLRPAPRAGHRRASISKPDVQFGADLLPHLFRGRAGGVRLDHRRRRFHALPEGLGVVHTGGFMQSNVGDQPRCRRRGIDARQDGVQIF